MQGLQQSYTQYFNRRHNKVGHLFQGRYHAIVCDRDEYLLALVRYIHLNPVRANMVPRPEQYHYTGHGEYCGVKGAGVIDSTLVLKLLGGTKGYQRFVLDGMGEGHKEEYYEVEDQRFLGEQGFAERIKERLGEEEASPRPRKPIGMVFGALARGLGINREILQGTDRSWRISKARAMVGYVLVRRFGYGLVEVASCLGRDMATVSSLISRLTSRMETDRDIEREVDRLAKIA